MSERNDLRALNKQAIRETLAGYAIAAEHMERERIERLRATTAEESRAIYAQLVNLHQQWVTGLKASEQEGLRRLEEWRLQTKLAVRQAFDRIAYQRIVVSANDDAAWEIGSAMFGGGPDPSQSCRRTRSRFTRYRGRDHSTGLTA
ncbi:hypothetical protein [Promineifilum sp.]|uniref:hypothetical protein n=1 Tax=Promineifilum sp. TaxID=2664178 RepID=UPI0035B08B1D